MKRYICANSSMHFKFHTLIQTFANNFDTMHPRFLILHCLEYGKYGITPTMLRAELVLQAYAMINSSMILLLTSLKVLQWICYACSYFISILMCGFVYFVYVIYFHALLCSSLNDINIFATNWITNFDHSFTIGFMIHGRPATFHTQAPKKCGHPRKCMLQICQTCLMIINIILAFATDSSRCHGLFTWIMIK